MTNKIIQLIVAGVISASYLGAEAQDLPKDTSQIVQQDSIYVQKSQANSLKKDNPGVLELRVKEIQIGRKTKIEVFYSSPNNSKVRGVSFVEKKKDVCKTLEELFPKSKEPRKIVYVTERENPFLDQSEIDELMKCLSAERYWIYRGAYFWD